VSAIVPVAIAVLVVGCGRRHFDALSDGATDGDTVDGAPACPYTFCDDFDRQLNVQQGWDSIDMSGVPEYSVGGQLIVTLDQTGELLYLNRSLPAPTSSVTVHLKLGYSTTNAGTNCEVDLLALRFESGACTTPFGFYLVRDGTDQFTLQETNGNTACTGNRDNLIPELTAGLHDVIMRIDVGPPGVARARLSIDGTMMVDAMPVQTVPASPMTLRLGGVISRNAAGTWTLTYDDLLVDVQ
jgi:hypothetical protein